MLSDDDIFYEVLGSKLYQGEVQRNKLVKELRKIYLDKGIEVGVEEGKVLGLEEGEKKGAQKKAGKLPAISWKWD